MKKIILFLLFLYCQIPSWGFDFQSNNFNFDFNGSSDNVILRSQVTPAASVVIPSKVNFREKDFNVKSIGDNAFANSNLEEVQFSEGLVEIGANAFRNTKINKVILPDSNESIGEYAFADCPNLKYVEFGKGIISSGYFRTLRHTFTNDDNIEKIVFRGNYPPMNFDYQPFSRMTRQFCKIYVPINGYYNFIASDSPWSYSFANNIIPYSPKGDKVEVVPYCMYYWDDTAIKNIYEIKGSRSSYNPYSGTTEYPLTLTIEECLDKNRNENVILRITFKGRLNDSDDFIDSGSYYAYLPNGSDFSEIHGEQWRIKSCDEKPYLSKISISFKKSKIKGLFKSKLADAILIKEEKNGNVKEATFFISHLPEDLNVEFKE